MEPAEIVEYGDPAGWVAQARHYPADGPPIVLVHGMGANHYNWDYDPAISPVDELNAAGWDVWILTLPGDKSSKAGPDAPVVDFDALVQVHLPAAVAKVLEVTGHEKVYWIGHSMGGMLLYASVRDLPIAAGVAISSPGQFHHATKMTKIASKGQIVPKEPPFDQSELVAKVAWSVPINPVVGLVGTRKHLDSGLLEGLASHALDDTPVHVTAQVASWVHADGEMRTQDGETLVDFHSKVPLLAFGGTKDKLVSDDDVKFSCERFVDCTYVELKGYGHVDTVFGTTAGTDVYPQMLEWLNAQRDAK